MSERLARTIVQRLQGAGHTALYAGGCVRDRLRGVAPHDYDVATDARPEQVQRMFSRTVAVGAAFGVVCVMDGGETVEVAAFRDDGIYIDGRHPESVTFSTPERDAQRRDFTVNGLFYDPLRDEVIDYVEGRRDLEAGMLRAIGCAADRFGRTGCACCGRSVLPRYSALRSSRAPGRRCASMRRRFTR